MKYKFTGKTKEVCGITLQQIVCVNAFGLVNAGDIGGWIESDKNLSHEGDCWVSGNGWVYGNGKVSGNGKVYGNGWVYGNGKVSGNGEVFGNGKVSGNGRVSGNGWVSGYGEVSGNAYITPINIIGLNYIVTITDNHIRIGCEFHTIEEWRLFTTDQIIELDGQEAVNFWAENKDVIITLADKHKFKAENNA